MSHCLLNPHTRVKGLEALHFKPEGPLIQLPCPEVLYLGQNRWAVTRNQLEVPGFRRFCKSLIMHYADLMEMMSTQGLSINIVGVAGSPSCGIFATTTGYQGRRVQESTHQRVPGRGVFMQELISELERRGIAFQCQETKQVESILMEPIFPETNFLIRKSLCSCFSSDAKHTF